MGDFWRQVGWILLGVFLGLIALVLVYFAFMNLIHGSFVLAILCFVGVIIFTVMSIVAFKQA